MSSVAALRERLKADRDAVRQAFLDRPDSAKFFRAHGAIIDRALADLWRLAAAPVDCALVAVGGYGRRELYPHSDVDVLILAPEAQDGHTSAALEGLVGALWDIGLELGHAVRSVAQCVEEAAKDITVATAMLEARQIAGNTTLYAQFEHRVAAALDPIRFFHGKRMEQEQRYEKYNDSPYSLEPNLKESPGGLRDLQVMRWVMRASGIGSTWRDLASRGLVINDEVAQLRRVEHFLQTARIQLHYHTRRREDRLLFDHQGELARLLGFEAGAHKRASEVLMQRYYRNAKSITQLNTIVLQNIGAMLQPVQVEPIVINERFQALHELLDARDPELFEREPAAIFESFLLLQQHAELKGMSASTLRAIWRARKKVDAGFRRDAANRARFIAMLKQPRGIVHEFRRMNQYGILGRYLPAFGRVVGQMQHDLFHVYTVDQHILTVVRNLRRFTLLEHSHEYPLCSRLITNFDKPWLLYLAAIFHDIAKGRGGDHSELGKQDARRFCRTHGLNDDETDLVVFLVERHLTMSGVAQREDLADPDVIRAFADTVKTERRLVALYLLTVADIRGTSPKVWNAWKGKLLEDLFRLTRRLLRGGSSDVDQDVQAKQTEAMRLLRLYALSDEAKDALWRELDVGYFLRHEPQEIAWQTRTLHYRVRSEAPVVKARLAPIGEGIQVLIYCRDQPELFARICGYFESTASTIADAKIHTTRHGYALDTFLVMGAAGEGHYRDTLTRIEQELEALLSGKGSLPAPSNRRVSRQLKHFPITPEVHLRPDDKGQFHVLTVTAGDRPGLLRGIASVLGRYGVNLRTAKIATLGERAEDVFVVDGEAFTRPKTVLQLETDLLGALS